MAKLIDLDGLAYFYGKIKAMLADKLGKNDTAVNASKVNNLTVETAVPKNAKFTDTVYTHPSTHPASMITGLSTVATSGSYNDLTNKPTIPSAYTLPNATSSTLGGVKIGSNISVADGTISITKSNVTSALGYTPPTSDTVYDNATATTAGLMSASDKVKLNNIADNANNYIHPPTHPAGMITGLAGVATSGSYNDLTDKPTIPAASTVDSELSSSSTNPVQNKVIKEALDGKLGKNETAAAAIKDGAGNTISTTYASKADVSALLSTKLGVTATAYAATRDGAGNNIVDTYAKKTDIRGMVKSVNGTAPDASGNVTVEEYTHPNSGVTAGTYRSVTVNAQGHVTGGSNPTLAIANGGTGATTASAALSNLGGVPTSEVANSANKIPRYNSSGHLVLPDGSEFWIA